VLLKTSLLSVKEIVGAVGAPERSHFARRFKKRFGMSMSDYKKAIPPNSDQ
jgi:AraC-like DNA-binding protein